MTERSGPDSETFRQAGHRAVDWIADYLGGSELYPVLSRNLPGDLRRRLPEAPPEMGEPLDTLLDDFEALILPGITHWNHPGFMAYFANTGSAPGILAEMLTAALNVNGMLWRTSPAATELEQVALDWLRQMLGLPEGMQGVITDTASMSSLLALTAAREAAELGVREDGMAGRSNLPRMVVYTSEQAHSSIEKAAIVLGFGQAGVRKIGVDERFRMRPDLLRTAIEEDRAKGLLPLALSATAGTTSTTSIDPLVDLGRICREEGLFFHVDAAYGGAAAVAPEYRWVLEGAGSADSLVVNPHKWLLTPMDCSAFYVKNPELLKRAFSLVPEYLRTAQDGDAAVENYMDWGVQLGRRFRGLKLWFVLRAYGREGLAEVIREHCRLAGLLAAWIDGTEDWERLAPVPLSTVCFRHLPDRLDSEEASLAVHNSELLDRLNAEGRFFLSHTVLDGRYSLRVAIGNLGTRERHLDQLWADLRRLAAGN